MLHLRPPKAFEEPPFSKRRELRVPHYGGIVPGSLRLVISRWSLLRPEQSLTELQRFLGFANFYRWFICNYTSVAAPLTALTSQFVPFRWSSVAAEAFSE